MMLSQEREKEREQRDEEMVSVCHSFAVPSSCTCHSVLVQTLLQRMREAEMFKEWEDQEDKVRAS